MSHLEIAKRIAMDAGAMIKSRMGTSFKTDEKSSSIDLVTEVDRASEQTIRHQILNLYPHHVFLGEEESYVNAEPFDSRLGKAAAEPFLWIVDPIDGTSNFVQGIPGFTVSIALACKGEITVGVICDPCSNELFWAEKGRGVFCNPQTIHTSKADQLSQCIIGTGFPTDERARAAVVESIGELSRKSRTIRSFGSAALHLAYVAAGRLGAYWEYGLNVWDMAAGIVIIREAGGNVTDTSGNPCTLSTRNIVASNGYVHQQMLDCMKPLATSANYGGS